MTLQVTLGVRIAIAVNVNERRRKMNREKEIQELSSFLLTLPVSQSPEGDARDILAWFRDRGWKAPDAQVEGIDAKVKT
jgi:hypothetical protein